MATRKEDGEHKTVSGIAAPGEAEWEDEHVIPEPSDRRRVRSGGGPVDRLR